MAQHIALVVTLIFALNTFTPGQAINDAIPLHRATLQALAYFQKVDGYQFDDYLTHIRPIALAPELRARVLNMVRKDDLVTPSAAGLAKLKALEPILKYHQRDSVIEFMVLRAPAATAVFLAGAAVIITEPALKLLTAEELQAVVAHELGHEYYWTRFDSARQNRDYPELQELELRCDGIAVVTLKHLGLDPESLVTAITKLNKYNTHPGSPGMENQNYTQNQNYVAFNERVAFIRRMIEMVRGAMEKQN